MEELLFPNFWIENAPYNWDALGNTQGYKYKKNQNLFFEGSKMDTVFLIKKGRVKLFITSEDGSEKIIGYIGQNSIVGTASLFHEDQYMFNATTVTNCTLLKFERGEFINKVMSNQALMEQILKIMSLRISILTRHTLDLSFTHSYQRLCKALIQLSLIYGEKQKDGTIFIDFKLTQKELSELIGSTRVTVSNHLKKLIDLNIIKKEKKHYIIQNIEVLKEECAEKNM